MKTLILVCLIILCLFSYAYSADQTCVDENGKVQDCRGFEKQDYTHIGTKNFGSPIPEQRKVQAQPQIQVPSEHQQKHEQYIRNQEIQRQEAIRAKQRMMREMENFEREQKMRDIEDRLIRLEFR